MSRKRKHKEQEDGLVLATGSNWSGEEEPNTPLKTKKIRVVRIDSDEDGDDEIMPIPLTNGGGSGSSLRLNGHIELENGEPDLPPDVWLIRKPTNVPTAELNKLRFSKKSKYQYQELSLNDDPQQSFECRLEKQGSTMLHAQAPSTTVINQKPTMKTVGNLKGMIWIFQNQTDDMEHCLIDPTI